MQKRGKADFYKKVKIKLGLCLLAFLLIICPALNLLNSMSEQVAWGWFVLEPGARDWFAFWGSFSGTIATVLVGIITIGLTMKLEENKEHTEALQKKSEQLQKKLSVVTNLPDMTCESVGIYSFNERDISQDFIERFQKHRNYNIYMELKPAFPAYLIVSLTKYELIFWSEGREEKSPVISGLLEGEDYSFTSHGSTKLYLNADERIEQWLEHMYFLHLESTNATSFENKSVKIRLGLKCENAMFPGKESRVEFEMVLTLVSRGKEKDCVRFEAIDIRFDKSSSASENII